MDTSASSLLSSGSELLISRPIGKVQIHLDGYRVYQAFAKQ